MFFLDFYLMLLLVFSTGFAVIEAMLWKIGVLNNSGLKRLELKEQLMIVEHPHLNSISKKIFWLVGIVNFIVIFYIFFVMNVSLEMMARYIIAVTYLFASVNYMTGLFVKTSILSSPVIDTELRVDYLASSSNYIYSLSFIIYFILWALNIPLFIPILYMTT